VTSPPPSGSAATANTIGIVGVACFACGTTLPDVNDVYLRPNKLGCDLRVAIIPPVGPTLLDCDGASLDPAKLPQSLRKRGDKMLPSRSRARTQEADGRNFPYLLRKGDERQARNRSADNTERAPAPHVHPQAQTKCHAVQTITDQLADDMGIERESVVISTPSPLLAQKERPGS
jgi:hypothetical protein